MKVCSICDINKVSAYCYESSARCDKECSAVLACGHSVRWKCARDIDPRLSSEFRCLGCILPPWERALTQDLPSPPQCEAFLKDMRSRASDVSREFQVEYVLPIDAEDLVNKFFKTRQSILKKYCDQMKLRAVEVRDPPAIFGSLEDLSNYRLVFNTAKLKDKKGELIPNNSETIKRLSRFLTSRDGTIMGMGSRLMDLSDGSVLGKLNDEDGMIKICVGAAFAFNKFPSDTPFRVVNDKSANKKSNELAVKHMAMGFDHVSVRPEKCTKEGIPEHVYWHPDTVIPLSILCLKVKAICCICGESTERNEGYMCSQSHFLCWTCFREYATNATAEGAIARSVDSQGNLRCPECVESYDLYRVASKVPPSVLETITDLKLKVMSNSKGESCLLGFLGNAISRS